VTPEQEEQVQRALGAVARAKDGPERLGIPLDVADRLDQVLHELVADRAARASTLPAPVGQDELAARRHRRWSNALVAAAAVAAIAAAGGAVATGGFGLSGQGDSGSSSASDSAAGEAAPKDAERGLTGPSGSSGGTTAVGIPRLSSDTLAGDVERVVANGPAAYLSPMKDNGRLAVPRHAAGVPCRRPAELRGGGEVDVYLNEEPATLVLGPVKDGTRVARVYSCANGSALTRALRVPSAR
jgi:hypothetical protein